MESFIPKLENLNGKFFHSKFCPQWVVDNDNPLGDLIDINTQCFVTAYAIMYLLTGSAENQMEVTKITIGLPIFFVVDDDEHMMVYYNGYLYESFHKKFKLQIKKASLYDLVHNAPAFLKENYPDCKFKGVKMFQSHNIDLNITEQIVLSRFKNL